MNKTIAVVDDEPDILELVSIHLEKSGFNVKKFKDATRLRNFLKQQIPDLLILDLMLPDEDGLEVCKSLKKNENLSSIPIIMLTAKGEEMDRILGLELGADDYVTKPFSPRELVARVKAVLRRTEEKVERKRIKINTDFIIYPEQFKVKIENEEVDLTTTEFKILEMLSRRRGWVFSREQILDYLWEGDKAVFDRTVDVHINHLRKKLGKHGDLIKSVRGVGYKMEE